MRLPRPHIPRPKPLSAFALGIVRSIKGSLGRFLAIFGIVALGCGFFAGLQMVGDDMRTYANEYYDGTNLYDIRVVSSLGFTSEDVDRFEAIEGVEHGMAAISFDVMADYGMGSDALRVSSLDMEKAERGKNEGVNAILSRDGQYLNRVALKTGRWPTEPNECVIGASVRYDEVAPIGSTIKILYGASDIDDFLDRDTFTIVGTVTSSNYPNISNLGSTTVGSGKIVNYVYLSESAFKEDAPFTEIYLTVEGAKDLKSGSDAYKDRVDEVIDNILDEQDSLKEARRNDLVKEGQDELEEGKQELETAKEEAEEKLDEGQKELDDAKAKLDEAQKQYDAGLSEWEAGRDAAYKQLDTGLQQVSEGQQKVDNLTNEIDTLTAQADATEAYVMARALEIGLTSSPNISVCRLKLKAEDSKLSNQIKSFDERQEAIDTVMDLEQQVASLQAHQSQIGTTNELRTARNVKYAQLATEKMTLQELYASSDTYFGRVVDDYARTAQEAVVSSLEAEVAGLDALILDAESTEQSINAIGPNLNATKRRLERLNDKLAKMPEEQTLRAQQAETASLISQADDVISSRYNVSAKKLELAILEATVDSGSNQYETSKASAEAELEKSKAKLDQAKKELDDGWREYEDGKREYEDGQREADEKIADAEQEIEDAQEKIDDVELPEFYILERTKNLGVETYSSDAGRIDAIAAVFPLMFFLVAALVALTTMTRMVEDERIEIGTYKALGYSTARIASKYLIYAGAASFLGAFVGVLVLSQVLPLIIILAYGLMYAVPIDGLPMPIGLGPCLQAFCLGVGITLLATWIAVVATLRESPAQLMLPKAPPAGKRILLERIKPLWSHLSFSWKVTLRNMFREKRRMFMTVVGISGCTALLLVGMALHDAIWDILDRQFGPIQNYDIVVGFDDEATQMDIGRVEDYLEGTDNAYDLVRMQHESMKAASDTTETKSAEVYVARSPEELLKTHTFRERVGQKELAFKDDSVLVSEKLARLLGVGTGDTITLFEMDDIGEADGSGMRLEVTGVYENYVGYPVFVGLKAWEDAGQKKPRFSTIEAKLRDGSKEAEAEVSDHLRAYDEVSTVRFTTDNIENVYKSIRVVDLVVWVLVFAAGILALIVIYNLTNINIGERIREIASLKVLGFTRREVYTYIFREVRLLSVIGDALGLFLGTAMARFVIVTAEADYTMFGRTIYPLSYVVAFVVTLIFAQLILVLMRKKLDQVDMVESLKSVD